MKTLRYLLMLATCLAAQLAFAQFDTLVRAVEVVPSNIILPASNNGMMTFRPCAEDCDADHERVRVTPETRFRIDGSGTKWENFRKVFPAISQSGKGYALVKYDTKNKTLISLEVAS